MISTRLCTVQMITRAKIYRYQLKKSDSAANVSVIDTNSEKLVCKVHKYSK